MTGINGPMSFALEMGLVPFTVAIFVLGFFISLGKAAVYKHIPVYHPGHLGAAGGVVSLVGGLGGFVLPIAFGVMNDLTGIWTSCFMLLFLIAAGSLAWTHFAIRTMERQAMGGELDKLPELPEMQEIHRPEHVGKLSGKTLEDWRPEATELAPNAAAIGRWLDSHRLRTGSGPVRRVQRQWAM